MAPVQMRIHWTPLASERVGATVFDSGLSPVSASIRFNATPWGTQSSALHFAEGCFMDALGLPYISLLSPLGPSSHCDPPGVMCVCAHLV